MSQVVIAKNSLPVEGVMMLLEGGTVALRLSRAGIDNSPWYTGTVSGWQAVGAGNHNAYEAAYEALKERKAEGV